MGSVSSAGRYMELRKFYEEEIEQREKKRQYLITIMTVDEQEFKTYAWFRPSREREDLQRFIEKGVFCINYKKSVFVPFHSIAVVEYERIEREPGAPIKIGDEDA